jgi:hypothetical protein
MFVRCNSLYRKYVLAGISHIFVRPTLILPTQYESGLFGSATKKERL